MRHSNLVILSLCCQMCKNCKVTVMPYYEMFLKATLQKKKTQTQMRFNTTPKKKCWCTVHLNLNLNSTKAIHSAMIAFVSHWAGLL